MEEDGRSLPHVGRRRVLDDVKVHDPRLKLVEEHLEELVALVGSENASQDRIRALQLHPHHHSSPLSVSTPSTVRTAASPSIDETDRVVDDHHRVPWREDLSGHAEIRHLVGVGYPGDGGLDHGECVYPWRYCCG